MNVKPPRCKGPGSRNSDRLSNPTHRHQKCENDGCFSGYHHQKSSGKNHRIRRAKCREEGRLDNFLMAGGQLDGTVKGEMPFDDTDVYKIIEGASYSLISAPNRELESLLDSLIAIIAVGQEEDGYLTTWRTINPAQPPADWVEVKEGKRWESLFMSHELYNAGHLYEAAYSHYQAPAKEIFSTLPCATPT